MVGNRVGGILPFPDGAHDDVGLGIHAGRNLGRGEIGNRKKRIAKVRLDYCELAVDLGDAVADLAHLLLRRGDVAALLGDHADFLGGGIALRLQRLRL